MKYYRAPRIHDSQTTMNGHHATTKQNMQQHSTSHHHTTLQINRQQRKTHNNRPTTRYDRHQSMDQANNTTQQQTNKSVWQTTNYGPSKQHTTIDQQVVMTDINVWTKLTTPQTNRPSSQYDRHQIKDQANNNKQ